MQSGTSMQKKNTERAHLSTVGTDMRALWQHIFRSLWICCQLFQEEILK